MRNATVTNIQSKMTVTTIADFKITLMEQIDPMKYGKNRYTFQANFILITEYKIEIEKKLYVIEL